MGRLLSLGQTTPCFTSITQQQQYTTLQATAQRPIHKMAYGFVPIVHIVAAVFSIIELGLTAYGKSGDPSLYYSSVCV
jgi:hypothetical protein